MVGFYDMEGMTDSDQKLLAATTTAIGSALQHMHQAATLAIDLLALVNEDSPEHREARGMAKELVRLSEGGGEEAAK